jgi:CRP/FNR family transcriptional regulator
MMKIILSISQIRTSHDMKSDLQTIEFLKDLPEDVILWLDAKTTWKDVEKGEYLFHEGEEACSMYFVVSGNVKIVKEFASGKNAILGFFGAGKMVAEVAAVDQKPYPASALVHEPSMVGEVEAEVFRELLTRAPEAAIRLIIGLGSKLRELTGNMSAMAVKTVEKRLARFLIKLADSIGEETDDGTLLMVPMTRRDLAEIIGSTFEVVERALKKMREGGILAVEGKKIVILKAAKLAELAGE